MLVIFILVSLQTVAQITYNEVRVDYDSVYEFKNLKIFTVRKKGNPGPGIVGSDAITLSSALQKGLVVISERGSASTENVHWLRVNNKTDKPLFIASGEVVVGGRQDRMITKDTMLLPNGGDQYIPAMCVEEGRWSEKERKFAYGSYANPRLRRVLDISKNQVLIWKEIYGQLDSSKVRSPTFAYNARRLEKKYQDEENEYVKYFRTQMIDKDSAIAGIICISGDRILGADVFNSTGLFHDQALALVTGYIEEAIAFGRTPDVKKKLVEEYSDQFLTDEISQEEYLKKNGKLFRHREKVIHITAYSQN